MSLDIDIQSTQVTLIAIRFSRFSWYFHGANVFEYERECENECEILLCLEELADTSVKTPTKHITPGRKRHPLLTSASQAVLLVCEMRASVRIRNIPNISAVSTSRSCDQ